MHMPSHQQPSWAKWWRSCRTPTQKNLSDCSGVAKHALALGSSDHVQSDPTEPVLRAQPVNTAFQSDPSQKSDKPKSPCMAPRATPIKEQGFSEVVAARIEAPVTVTGKHGSNYRLSLSCNRKTKKLNLTNLFNSQ